MRKVKLKRVNLYRYDSTMASHKHRQGELNCILELYDEFLNTIVVIYLRRLLNMPLDFGHNMQCAPSSLNPSPYPHCSSSIPRKGDLEEKTGKTYRNFTN
jgi:hypothetical protein